MKIYLVEDNKDSLELLKKIFSKDEEIEIVGHNDNADEAIPEILDKNPDLVLMDILLNGALDGIEAADILHAKGFNRPILFTSAYDSDKFKGIPEEFIIRKPWPGVNQFLAKISLFKRKN